MDIKNNFSDRSDEILLGIRKAVAKVVQESAARNEELIVAENGIPKSVPAKELLKKLNNPQQ